jgi:hypothetical protein
MSSTVATKPAKKAPAPEPEVPIDARAALWCRVCGGEGSVLVDPKPGVEIKDEECRPYVPAPCPACHGERAVFVDLRRLREVRSWAP